MPPLLSLFPKTQQLLDELATKMSDDSSSNDWENNGGSVSANNNGGSVSGECIDETELDGTQKGMLTHHVKTELFEKGCLIINKDAHQHAPEILRGTANHLSIPVNRFLNCKNSIKKTINEKLNNC